MSVKSSLFLSHEICQQHLSQSENDVIKCHKHTAFIQS